MYPKSNEPTRYEVVLCREDDVHENYLIGYTAQKSAAGVLKMARSGLNGSRIAEKVGDCAVCRAKDGRGFWFGSWFLGFSGRTERDALGTGELSSI